MSKIKEAMTGWTRTFGVDGQQTAEYKSAVVNFDKSGHKTEEMVYGELGNLEHHIQCDNKGRAIQEVYYNSDGSINFRYSFEYDSAGNEIVQAMFFTGDQFHGRWVSKFDNSGQLVKRQWRNRSDEIEVTETYEYGENGKLARKSRGAVAEWVYTYDANGNLSRIKGGYFSSDEPEDIELHNDEHGDLQEKIELYPTGAIMKRTRYEYVFWG